MGAQTSVNSINVAVNLPKKSEILEKMGSGRDQSYEGSFDKNGKRSGKGKCTYRNGAVYEG